MLNLNRFHWMGAFLAVMLATGCPPISENVKYTKDILYGWGYVATNKEASDYELNELYLDVLEPQFDHNPQKPAVVFVHGGNFQNGAKDGHDLLRFADRFASQGYVCFLIQYRLERQAPPEPDGFGPGEAAEAQEEEEGEDLFEGEDQLPPEKAEPTVPAKAAVHAAFVDLKAAIRYVRTNAELFSIDPERVAVFGEDAGAFAALAAGLTEPERYAADSADYPTPNDNYPDADPKANLVIDFWGSADFFLDAFDAGDPPLLIVHGTNDIGFRTRISSAEAIAKKCENKGIPYEFHKLIGEDGSPWNAQIDGMDLATIALNFVEKHMPGTAEEE